MPFESRRSFVDALVRPAWQARCRKHCRRLANSGAVSRTATLADRPIPSAWILQGISRKASTEDLCATLSDLKQKLKSAMRRRVSGQGVIRVLFQVCLVFRRIRSPATHIDLSEAFTARSRAAASPSMSMWKILRMTLCWTSGSTTTGGTPRFQHRKFLLLGELRICWTTKSWCTREKPMVGCWSVALALAWAAGQRIGEGTGMPAVGVRAPACLEQIRRVPACLQFEKGVPSRRCYLHLIVLGLC